jgi:hypothetical protein
MQVVDVQNAEKFEVPETQYPGIYMYIIVHLSTHRDIRVCVCVCVYTIHDTHTHTHTHTPTHTHTHTCIYTCVYMYVYIYTRNIYVHIMCVCVCVFIYVYISGIYFWARRKHYPKPFLPLARHRQIYVSPHRRRELECVQHCAQSRELSSLSHCRLACRSIATSELVLERRRREAGHTVTPNEIKLWKQQLQHVLAIISDIERGSSGSGAGDSMGDAKGGYHLYLAAAVYRQLLSLKQAFATEGGAQIADPNASPDCQEFVEVLESIPATGAHTLSYYEAVMHTCACFFLHNKYSRSTALYWQHFYRLPSLLEPLERIRQVPVVRHLRAGIECERRSSVCFRARMCVCHCCSPYVHMVSTVTYTHTRARTHTMLKFVCVCMRVCALLGRRFPERINTRRVPEGIHGCTDLQQVRQHFPSCKLSFCVFCVGPCDAPRACVRALSCVRS